MKLWLKGLALSVLAVLAPIHTVMITVCILIIADLITGIWAAYKRGEKLTSAAMRRTITKLLIYQLTVITGFLLEKYLLEGLVPASKLIASVIGLVEMKSVLENAESILGQPLFKKLISRLGSDNDKPDSQA